MSKSIIYIYEDYKIYKNRDKLTRLLLSHLHMNINPKGTQVFTTVVHLVEVDILEVDNNICNINHKRYIKFYLN